MFQKIVDAVEQGDTKRLKKLLLRRGWFTGLYHAHLSLDDGYRLLKAALQKGEASAQVVWEANTERQNNNAYSVPFLYYPNTLLYHFIEEQNIAGVRFLLKQSLTPELRDLCSDAVFWATWDKNYNGEIISVLLDNGFKIDSMAVDSIMRHGDVATLRRLTDAGVDVKNVYWKLTPEKLSDEIILLLLDGQVQTPTAFRVLCRTKSVSLAEQLCQLGIDINKTDIYGCSPVMRTQSAGVFDLLLSKGARTDLTDCQGNTVWNGLTADFVKIALKHGMKPNAVANLKTGETVLMQAVSRGSKKAVALLIEAGADVHATDVSGKTLWAHVKDVSIMELLKNGGLDINARNDNGDTPLMIDFDLGPFYWLIRNGADVNARNDKGETALMVVPGVQKVSALLKAGADVNAQDKDGKTALMGAQTAKMVNMLLQAGANPNLCDTRGNNALHAVLTNKKTSSLTADDVEIVRSLLMVHGDVSHQNANGETPLTIACRNWTRNQYLYTIFDLLKSYERLGAYSLIRQKAIVQAPFRGHVRSE